MAAAVRGPMFGFPHIVGLVWASSRHVGGDSTMPEAKSNRAPGACTEIWNQPEDLFGL